MELLKTIALLVINIVLNRVSCHVILGEHDDNYEETTVEMQTVETTTQEIVILTDIPQSEVDAAVNIDVGVYTTQTFDYDNFSFLKTNRDEDCYTHYIKCTMNLGILMPMCSVNDPFEIPYGYDTEGSICDVYLDNCRRLRHFWRILDYGRCVQQSKEHVHLEQTKRRSDVERPWGFIFTVLGSEDIYSKHYPYSKFLSGE